MGEVTSPRTFTEEDQENFARWSGDRNPIHMDTVAARRTAAGAPVVHGIHLLLWALDEALEDEPLLQSPIRVKADFRKFVFIGQPVSLDRSAGRDGSVVLRLVTGDGTVASVRVGRSEEHPGEVVPSAPLTDVTEPQALTIDETRDLSGFLRPMDRQGIGDAFPRLRDRLSEGSLAELAQVSALVGMVCPGLHSILAGIDVEVGSGESRGIAFRTSKVDERYSLVRMEVAGAGVRGSVEAFMRPQPIRSIAMGEAAKLVRAQVFSVRRALVIGGSRGLGAVTAKLLAAGGAGVSITYAKGASEAADICEEISASGRATCAAMPLDVLEPSAEQLARLPSHPTHIYYFATPRIFLQKTPEFDRKVFERFVDFYVEGFNRICTFFAAASAEPVTILYPSSVAVTERPPGLIEYAMAKAAGELLCADLGRVHPNLRIRVERLPRILTDQTATVQPVKSASAEEILLPLLMC